MGKGTLGPFPKTRRWWEIVLSTRPSVGRNEAEMLSDVMLCLLKAELERLEKDSSALRAVTFWIALPIATRAPNPIKEVRQKFGIGLGGADADDLKSALIAFAPESVARSAVLETLADIHVENALISTIAWDKWRAFDGPNFCNLAYRFFTNLSRQLHEELLPEASPEAIETFAKESAIITRAFSARWFNACARLETPGHGSIRWYWGHCLGKLDLEASREMSNWVEPPKKRKAAPEPTLDL